MVFYRKSPLRSGFGEWGGLGTGPCRGPSPFSATQSNPGSLGGLPASRLSIPVLSIRCMYTLPTTIVCASATLPLPLPLSALFAFTALFPPPFLLAVFLLFVWSYTGCPPGSEGCEGVARGVRSQPPQGVRGVREGLRLWVARVRGRGGCERGRKAPTRSTAAEGLRASLAPPRTPRLLATPQAPRNPRGLRASLAPPRNPRLLATPQAPRNPRGLRA